MDLKHAILKAFENNLTYLEGQVEKKPPIEKGSKLDTLSEDLAKAIKDYIDSLTFRVNSLKGDTVLPIGAIVTNTGANTFPVPISITVSLDNPTGITDASNSLQSVVKVDKNENIDKSGVV